MEFSDRLMEQISAAYENRVFLFGERAEEISQGLKNLTTAEQTAVKFLYANMPLNDIGDYDFSLFLNYVKHSLFLAAKGPFKENITEADFLHYILFHRCSSEKIEDSRGYLFEQLYPRISGMNMKDAALEINNWCLEMATYQPTDRRTAGPLTLCKSGYGRCGEEAVLLVAALRSVGIPARVTFTPRWSHCDNNHAWVEMWCDGSWYFTGACEPNAVLNQGWFSVPASRAMMINSVTYSDIAIMEDEVMQKNGASVLLNNLSIYAKITKLIVKVVDGKGNPVPDIAVSFEILNTGEFFPVAKLDTDENGCVAISTGLGGICIRTGREHQKVSYMVDTRKETFLTLCMEDTEEKEVWKEILLPAPLPKGPVFQTATKEEEEKQNLRNEDANHLRAERVVKAYDETFAMRYQDNEIMRGILKDSCGNFEELRAFLETEIDGVGCKEKEELLVVLPKKDLTDITTELLIEHLILSLPYRMEYEEDIYTKYILCPRILHEELTKFRSYILNYLTEQEKTAYQSDPERLWSELNQRIRKPGEDYLCQLSTPIGTLKLNMGILPSKRILFVAILRTLGIPARLNPVDGKASYYKQGDFITVEKEVEKRITYSCKLTLSAEGEPEYYHKWTIGRKNEQGEYQTLVIKDQWKDNQLELMLEDGDYRILTVNRMGNGDLLANSYHFNMLAGDIRQLRLELPVIQAKDLIHSFKVPDGVVMKENGEECSLKELTKEGKQVFLFLEPGKEPTEHILREILLCKDELLNGDIGIHIILSSLKQKDNKTLCELLDAAVKADVYWMKEMNLPQRITEAADILLDGLPCVLVTEGCLAGIYGVSGYNVGTAEFVSKVLQA